MTLDEFKAAGGTVESVPRGPMGNGPKYDVISPDGFSFDGETHHFTAFTMADLCKHLKSIELVKCNPGCECGLS